MDTVLKKDEALELPQQISNILRQRIESGEYQPGKRLGGIRQFAASFSVNPVTFIRALDILEAEKLIDRVPSKGIFVAERLRNRKRRLKACFAFPEKNLMLSGTPENISANTELYRGLLAGAVETGTDLQFSHFEDNPSDALLEDQLAQLRSFDSVIFTGWQLAQLQERAAAEHLVFRVGSAESVPGKVTVADYDRRDAREKLFDLYRNSGCRSAVSVSSEKRSRAVEFLERVRNAGGSTPDGGFYLITETGRDDILRRITHLLTVVRPEFIFCDYTDITTLIYEAALDLQLSPGRDFQMTGIAVGLTLAELLPRYTFLRIPRFELGQQIMQQAAASIRDGVPVPFVPPKVELVEGKTVFNKNNERIKK